MHWQRLKSALKRQRFEHERVLCTVGVLRTVSPQQDICFSWPFTFKCHHENSTYPRPLKKSEPGDPTFESGVFQQWKPDCQASWRSDSDVLAPEYSLPLKLDCQPLEDPNLKVLYSNQAFFSPENITRNSRKRH